MIDLRIRKSDWSSDLDLWSSKNWVTNGHWAIKKDCLDYRKHAELIAHAQNKELGEDLIKQMTPTSFPNTYRITGEIQNELPSLEPDGDVVVFIREDGTGKRAGFKRKYVRMFNLTKSGVKGSDLKHPFVMTNDINKIWLIIMSYMLKENICRDNAPNPSTMGQTPQRDGPAKT